jgi:hypothetical protein
MLGQWVVVLGLGLGLSWGGSQLNKFLLKNSRHIMPIMIDPVDRLPTEHDLHVGEDIIVNAGKRNAVYKGTGSIPRWFSDDPAKKLDFSPNAAYCPSWYNPKATHGETASLTVDMPSWDIVDRARMATVFVYQQLKPTQDDQDNSVLLYPTASRSISSKFHP